MSHLFRHKDVPKSMPIKETEMLLKNLKELRRISLMKNASFTADDETNEMIKNETKIYRQTWLVRPLDEMIERYENFLE